MRQIAITLILTFLSQSSIQAQQKSSAANEPENFYGEPDTSRLHVAFIFKDSTKGYLNNTTVWYVDDKNRLILVRHTFGNHPGKSSGHLIRVNSFYFLNDTLRKVILLTNNFAKPVSKNSFVFDCNRKPKGMTIKVFKRYAKQGEYFLRTFRELHENRLTGYCRKRS